MIYSMALVNWNSYKEATMRDNSEMEYLEGWVDWYLIIMFMKGNSEMVRNRGKAEWCSLIMSNMKDSLIMI